MYYSILDLDENANMNDIKTSYKKLARKWHPDKHQNKNKEELYKINQKFNKINFAYNKLLNENNVKKVFLDTRIEYDNIDNIYYNKLINNDNQNINIENNLTIEDIYKNIFKKITYKINKRCINCIGNGYVNISNPDNCFDCNGLGIINNKKCTHCKGIGKYIDNINICKCCLGNKYIIFVNTLYYNYNDNIIKDINNIKLRYTYINNKNNIIYKIINKGNESEQGTGNLILTIYLTSNENFKILNNDLYMNQTISLSESLVGFINKILLPNNEIIFLKNENKVIKPNELLLIKGFGINKNKIKGDLLIKFNIMFPDEITKSNKKKIISIFGHNYNNYKLNNNVVVNL